METTLAVMERQQQFDFQKNGIEVMNFETLQRTYKENDIYNNPVQGIYRHLPLSGHPAHDGHLREIQSRL